MEPILTGIIGCGNISGMHADVLSQLPNVKVAGVCDIHPERAQALAQRFHCPAYSDYRELLARPEIQCVHICTPHYLHASMSIDALQAGKYVICEKPMAIFPEDAQAMIRADQQAGGNHLCVVFQNRYNASSQTLKQIIQSNEMGRLLALRGQVVWCRTPEYYSDDWHGSQALEGGGVLINQAIHTLDLVQWLGGGVSTLRGHVSCDKLYDCMEVEDSAHGYMQLQNGASALFYATIAYAMDSPIEIEAVFAQGIARLCGDSLSVTCANQTRTVVDTAAADTGHKGYWGTGHTAQISDFYHCVSNGLPFFIDGIQGLEAVKLVQGFYTSSRTGKPVRIN